MNEYERDELSSLLGVAESVLARAKADADVLAEAYMDGVANGLLLAISLGENPADYLRRRAAFLAGRNALKSMDVEPERPRAGLTPVKPAALDVVDAQDADIDNLRSWLSQRRGRPHEL